MPVRILVADDHTMIRQMFKNELERCEDFEVVGEASDGYEAIRGCRDLHPDVAVLDISMPLLNGVDAAREIRKVCPQIVVVLLTMHGDDRFVLEGLRAGIRGYVVKTQYLSGLVDAIRNVSKGEVYLSPGISRTVIDASLSAQGPSTDPLSLREREVLQLVAEGKATKEIATILGISDHTTEVHRANIMQKLEIHDVAGLVRYAVRKGLIEA